MYRLKCPCDAELTVTSGQAGGVARCPACGGKVEVPRLRDLADFAVGDDEAAGVGGAAGRWRWCQAGLFLGLVVATTAALAAVAVPRLGLGGFARLPDEAMIRAAVDRTDLKTLLEAWSDLKDTGVDRGAMPEEVRVKQVAGLTDWISSLLWGLSGIGLLAAAGSGAACLATTAGTQAQGRRR